MRFDSEEQREYITRAVLNAPFQASLQDMPRVQKYAQTILEAIQSAEIEGVEPDEAEARSFARSSSAPYLPTAEEKAAQRRQRDELVQEQLARDAEEDAARAAVTAEKAAAREAARAADPKTKAAAAVARKARVAEARAASQQAPQ